MPTPAQLLPLPVVLPLIGAVLAPLAARRARRAPLWVAVTALSASLAVLLGVAARVFAGTGHLLTHFLSNEHPVRGASLGIALVADPFGLTFATLATGVGIV